MAQVLDIGVDLGTASVVIYGKNKGVVLDEPAVIAIDRDTRNVLAVGEEAHRMLGRTPGNIVAMRPLRDGMIEDFELTATMLNYFVGKVIGKQGRIAKAIRSVLKAATPRDSKPVFLEIQ